MILRAVLAARPTAPRGRAGVEEARRLGRAALEESARVSGFELPAGTPPFPRDAERAPLPIQRTDGHGPLYWSTTNTTGLVVALVAPVPVGVDAEWLGRPRSEAVVAYVPEGERQRTGLATPLAAFAIWSAREAVVKCAGIGMAAMGDVALVDAPSAGPWSMRLGSALYHVRQLRDERHVVSVAARSTFELEPHVLAEAVA